MKHTITFLKEYLKGKTISYRFSKDGDDYFKRRVKEYNHKKILDIDEANELIKGKILSGDPFMVGRFGATELATVKTFDFEIKSKYVAQLNRVGTTAGLFPETEEIGKKFAEIMIDCIGQLDLIGVWPLPFEEYYLREYSDDSISYTWLRNLEPWLNPSNPWSSALAGKKVLVVNLFSESISNQYNRRKEIFPDTDILPDFSLETMKSVWTSKGCDSRFSDWFNACDYMKEEILRREFDIAILGCGAYGFPLAAEIKKAGKQAIHLGGATQLLFGIIGTRWETDKDILALKNDSWIRPMQTEKPIQAEQIENAAYW